MVAWPEARDLSPAASRVSLMILSDTAGPTYARISSLDAVRVATTARRVRRS